MVLYDHTRETRHGDKWRKDTLMKEYKSYVIKKKVYARMPIYSAVCAFLNTLTSVEYVSAMVEVKDANVVCQVLDEMTGAISSVKERPVYIEDLLICSSEKPAIRAGYVPAGYVEVVITRCNNDSDKDEAMLDIYEHIDRKGGSKYVAKKRIYKGYFKIPMFCPD